VVPGLRAALAERWRRLDARWTGQRYGERADLAEQGSPITVDFLTLFSAMFGLGVDARTVIEDGTSYTLEPGSDRLTRWPRP